MVIEPADFAENEIERRQISQNSAQPGHESVVDVRRRRERGNDGHMCRHAATKGRVEASAITIYHLTGRRDRDDKGAECDQDQVARHAQSWAVISSPFQSRTIRLGSCQRSLRRVTRPGRVVAAVSKPQCRAASTDTESNDSPSP